MCLSFPCYTHGCNDVVWKSGGRERRRAEYRNACRDCAAVGTHEKRGFRRALFRTVGRLSHTVRREPRLRLPNPCTPPCLISSISFCACCRPPIRAKIARACSNRPSFASHLGLSGMRKRANINTAAGSASEANIHRQEYIVFHSSEQRPAINQSTMYATTMPRVIANWFSVTRAPLFFAGDISAIYIGEIGLERPMAIPPTSLAIMNTAKAFGVAVKMAEARNKKADAIRIHLRPSQSLKKPATLTPSMHPNKALLTAMPSWKLVREKYCSINTTAPEITAVS